MSMGAEVTEYFATALSYVSVLPTFDNVHLFTNEIADIMGFQIFCAKNNEGRVVFALDDRKGYYSSASENFVNNYKTICGHPPKKESDPENKIYPTMGSDSLMDIAPNTLARMLKMKFEENTELNTVLPMFFMRLAKEAQTWEKFFANMHKKSKILKDCFSNICEKSI